MEKEQHLTNCTVKKKTQKATKKIKKSQNQTKTEKNDGIHKKKKKGRIPNKVNSDSLIQISQQYEVKNNKKITEKHTDKSARNTREKITDPNRKKALTLWYTNADTLTSDKIQELKSLISSADQVPDIIAICEYKPKNYSRELTP